MKPFLNLMGNTYKNLTVVALHERANGRGTETTWVCACACGTQNIIATTGRLRAGTNTSCGCLRRKPVKHGLTCSPEYRSWQAIKKRCYWPKAPHYKDYGGRGITMCDRWLRSFKAFYGDMGPRPNKHSIDRIDVNGNYEPSNCKWATVAEQNRNKRTNVYVEYRGEMMVLTDAAALAGISSSLASSRIQRGISLDKPLGRHIK